MRRLIRLFILFLVEISSAFRPVGFALCNALPISRVTRSRLREQALLKVEPQVFVPTTSRPVTQRFPWKTNIVTTVFWIGEQAGGNNPVPNNRSCWDLNWTANYGGYDNPDSSARRDYIPVGFTPRQNPFYCAFRITT